MIDASKMMNEFEDIDRRLTIMQSRAEVAERDLAALKEQTRWRKLSQEKPPAEGTDPDWVIRIKNGELYWAYLPEPPEVE